MMQVKSPSKHWNYKHGYARKKSNSSTYNAWEQMRKRCRWIKGRDYKNYGARGITVCCRWSSFSNFLADMGESPPEKSLERINNEMGYSPENCKWATRTEQNNNQRKNIFIKFNGERWTISQWAKKLNLMPDTLWARIKIYGWGIEKALTLPKSRFPHEYSNYK